MDLKEKYNRALRWIEEANRTQLLNAMSHQRNPPSAVLKRSTKELRGNLRTKAKIGHFDVDNPFA